MPTSSEKPRRALPATPKGRGTVWAIEHRFVRKSTDASNKARARLGYERVPMPTDVSQFRPPRRAGDDRQAALF